MSKISTPDFSSACSFVSEFDEKSSLSAYSFRFSYSNLKTNLYYTIQLLKLILILSIKMVASVAGTNSPLLPFVKQTIKLGRPKKPKKRPAPPTNMYILYFQDMYKEYINSYLKPFYDMVGGRNMRKFAREVANKWKVLPQAEKDKYRQKYLELRQAKIDQDALAQKAQQQMQQAQAIQQLQQARALQQAQLAGQQQAAAQQVQVPQAIVPPQLSASASAQAQGQAPATQGALPNPRNR